MIIFNILMYFPFKVNGCAKFFRKWKDSFPINLPMLKSLCIIESIHKTGDLKFGR